MSDAESQLKSIEPGEVTRLLENLKKSPENLDQIIALVYEDIHRIAHFQRMAMGGAGPQTTVLVHEAFLKIFSQDDPRIADRVHLKRITAMAVRQLIVDQARARMSQKRGGDVFHTNLNERQVAVDSADAEYVLSVERALQRLERRDKKLAELVVGSYFGGYTVDELAELAGSSRRTIQRQLKRARGWLRLELEEAP